MAVSSIKVVFILSIMEIMLPNINCQIQWSLIAGEFGTPELYAAIVNNSAIAQDLLKNQLEQHNEIKELLQSQTEATTQMVATQNQIADTQAQMAASQTRMENALGQIVNLLQVQSQQLENMTATMVRVVSVLENQQETLEKISAQSQQSQNATESENVDSCDGNQVAKLLKSVCIAIQEQKSDNVTEGVTIKEDPTKVEENVMTTVNNQLSTNTQTHLETTPLENVMTTMNKQLSTDTQTHFEKTPLENVMTTINKQLSTVTQTHLDTYGGGWTVFQRRYDGSVDFNRTWDEYEEGFGSLGGEFWLGLRKIHELTQSGSWVLRVDIEAFDGSTAYALYDPFRVGNAETNYRLSLGTYEGTASDSMRGRHDLSNMQFTTYDRDNDVWNSGNCAERLQGAWWYRECCNASLNGRYLGPSDTSSVGMFWYFWKSNFQSLKRSEMKIRRAQ